MDYVFSYTDRPSQAVLCHRGQFILMATRSGALITPMLDIVDPILDDLAQLRQRMPQDEHSTTHWLMLRGLWFDDAHGCLVLHIEQLHPAWSVAPLSEQEIEDAMHVGTAYYGGQAIVAHLTTTPSNIHSDYFDPILDSHYDEVKVLMGWN